MNIAAIAHATARLRAIVEEYSGPGAEIVASIDLRQPAPNSCQRLCPVSIEMTALMPVLNGTSQELPSRVMRTGMRCTTFTQLPEMFSDGSGENALPLAGDTEPTVPRQSQSGYVSIFTSTLCPACTRVRSVSFMCASIHRLRSDTNPTALVVLNADMAEIISVPG